MHIVFGAAAKELSTRFVILELDTFRDTHTQQQHVAYCLIENIPLDDMPILQELCDCHRDLIFHYQHAQWSLCLEQLPKLRGRWNGEVDSFYDDLQQRIDSYSQQTVQPGWDYALPKSFVTSG